MDLDFNDIRKNFIKKRNIQTVDNKHYSIHIHISAGLRLKIV